MFTKSERAGLVYSFLSNNHFLHKQRGSTFYFHGLYLPEGFNNMRNSGRYKPWK
jgi:hypothetical protein